MRLLTIILTILWQSTFGQVGQSVSVDKQDVLTYSIDSLIHKLEKERRIERIIVKCDSISFNRLTKTIQNREVVRYQENRKGKAKDIRTGDILVKVSGPAQIENQIQLLIVTLGKRGKGIGFIEGGGYKFFYNHFSGSYYKLARIEIGIVL